MIKTAIVSLLKRVLCRVGHSGGEQPETVPHYICLEMIRSSRGKLPAKDNTV